MIFVVLIPDQNEGCIRHCVLAACGSSICFC